MARSTFLFLQKTTIKFNGFGRPGSMGCGASAPVRDEGGPVGQAVTPADEPDDGGRTQLPKASSQVHEPACEHEAAPGPQAAAAPALPGTAPADSSPREGGTAAPSAPEGVGGETADARMIAYHESEGEERLQWGAECFTAEELAETLEGLDQSAAQHSLEEWLPRVREDALRYSEAYEGLRKAEGGPEALEEVAHECAAIREKILEDRSDDDAAANASFDNGEGNEEPVDNFWNEPFFLLVSAAKVHGKFSEWVASIATQTGADASHSVCFKPIHSAAQKARRPGWQRGGASAAPGGDTALEAGRGRGWGSLVDIVRASVVVDDWQGVLRCLQAVRGDFDVEILRIRNRFTATADVPQIWGGYRHIALTVRLLGHGHVCELLVHHRLLHSLRSPQADERFHHFRDALAWAQKGPGGTETFVQLLSPRA